VSSLSRGRLDKGSSGVGPAQSKHTGTGALGQAETFILSMFWWVRAGREVRTCTPGPAETVILSRFWWDRVGGEVLAETGVLSRFCCGPAGREVPVPAGVFALAEDRGQHQDVCAALLPARGQATKHLSAAGSLRLATVFSLAQG
jgi:hypothetical protein